MSRGTIQNKAKPFRIMTTPLQKRRLNRFETLPTSRGGRLALILLSATALAVKPLPAANIAVPNASFESQPAPNTFPFVNVFVDSWQKINEPAYYGPAIGTPFGIPWIGTAGVFLDVNPYANHLGSQCGYILGFPQVTLFQDYNSSPTHDFNASFQVGMSYNLTLGVFGKDTLAPGSTLALSLYYLDDLNQRLTIGSTIITYSQASFPTNQPLQLVDYSVFVPTVQAGDAWAGKHIGIELESTTPLQLATGGNWDFDNVRLIAVPEPSTIALLILAAGGLFVAQRRARR
jgi:hypothetical protein